MLTYEPFAKIFFRHPGGGRERAPGSAGILPAINSVNPSAGWKPALPGTDAQNLPPIAKNYLELL